MKGLVLNYLSFVLSGYLVAPMVLRGRKFDAVFVYAPSPLIQALPAILVAWLKNAPLVLWVQDIWPDALQATGFVRNTWLLSSVEMLMRYIYRHCDSILIQSEGFRSSVEKLVDDPEKVRFFPNSAEAMPERPDMNESSGDIARNISERFSVVFAGNIGTVQSCETIVEAAGLLQKHRNIRFYLVGGGSKAQAIAGSIAVKKLDNVTMTGRVPANEIPGIYEAASVLLLSFQRGSTLSATIPSKLQGYLAAGRPIIVSSDGESANVLNEANAGLTCPPGDPQALADTVLKLYKMTADERGTLGANGQRYFMANFHLPDRVSELMPHLKISSQHVDRWNLGMKILVTGANGFVGHALCKHHSKTSVDQVVAAVGDADQVPATLRRKSWIISSGHDFLARGLKWRRCGCPSGRPRPCDARHAVPTPVRLPGSQYRRNTQPCQSGRRGGCETVRLFQQRQGMRRGSARVSEDAYTERQSLQPF